MRERKHFLEIFKIQVDEIILQELADVNVHVPIYWLGCYVLILLPS